jgi:hypothetical protein
VAVVLVFVAIAFKSIFVALSTVITGTITLLFGNFFFLLLVSNCFLFFKKKKKKSLWCCGFGLRARHLQLDAFSRLCFEIKQHRFSLCLSLIIVVVFLDCLCDRSIESASRGVAMACASADVLGDRRHCDRLQHLSARSCARVSHVGLLYNKGIGSFATLWTCVFIVGMLTFETKINNY